MSKPALKMVREDGEDSVLDQGYTKRLQSKEKGVQIMLVTTVIIAYLIMRCVIGASLKGRGKGARIIDRSGIRHRSGWN